MKKNILAMLLLLSLVGCGAEENVVEETVVPELIPIEIAVDSQIQGEILSFSQNLFEEEGYDLTVVQSTQGNNHIGQETGTVIYYDPIGLYGEAYEVFPQNATMAIDGRNLDEPLLFLESIGLITLVETENYTIESVLSNQNKIKFLEVAAPEDMFGEADFVVTTGEKAFMKGLPLPLLRGETGAVFASGEDIVGKILTGNAMQNQIQRQYGGQLRILE